MLCNFLKQRPPVARNKVRAYLFRAVHNHCVNLKTRRKVENSSVSLDNITSSAWQTVASLDFLAQMPEYEPQEPQMELEEIVAYSETLPERTRRIFYMSRIEGMTHKEIAEAIGISTRAVEKHLQSSVRKYREHFGIGKSGDGKTS